MKLIHPLEESKNSIRFVAEPLFSSLKQMIDVNGSNVGSSSLEGFELDELAIQKGLLQVSEALDFLHNTASSVHLDIQPCSVLINVKGDWKLFGLGFVEPLKNADLSARDEYFIPRFDGRLPPYIQINFDFSAPELVLDHKLDPANDIFSLGLLLITLFINKPPMRTENSSSVYKQEFQHLNKVLRDPRIPSYLHDLLPQMLARYPNNRINLSELKSSPLFDNILIRTINFLDDFPAKLPAEQQAFMNGFSKLIDQFPKSVLQKKILPAFLEELGKEEVLVGPILTNVFIIGKEMSQLGFSEKILPALRRVKDTLSAKVTTLNNIEILKSRVKGDEFRDDILPIALDAMENAPPEIQETALQKVPVFIEKLDFVTLKNEVFPKVASVFAKTTSLAVKLEALKAFQQLVVSGLDKYTVTDKLLPLLASMKTREPSVMMGALAVYEKSISLVEVETLARQVIPQLLHMSMESMLNLGQFKQFMEQIHRVLDQVERDHTKRLSQVQVSSNSSGATGGLSSFDGNNNKEDGPIDFEDLVFGKKTGKKSPSNETSKSLFDGIQMSTSNLSTPKPSNTTLSGSYAAGPKALNPLMPTFQKPEIVNTNSQNLSSSFGVLTLETPSQPSFKPLSPPPQTPSSRFGSISHIPSSPFGNNTDNLSSPSNQTANSGFGLLPSIVPSPLNSFSSVKPSSQPQSPGIDWSKAQSHNRTSSQQTSFSLNSLKPMHSTSLSQSSTPINTFSLTTTSSNTSSGGIDWSKTAKPLSPAILKGFSLENSSDNSFGGFQTASKPAVSALLPLNSVSSSSKGVSGNSNSFNNTQSFGLGVLAPMQASPVDGNSRNSGNGFSLAGLTPLSPSHSPSKSTSNGFGSSGGGSLI